MKISGLSNYDFKKDETILLRKKYCEEFETLLSPLFNTRTRFFASFFHLIFTISTLTFLACGIFALSSMKGGLFMVVIIPLAVSLVISIITYFPLKYFSKKLKGQLENIINLEQILKTYLENKYDDVKVSSALQLEDSEVLKLLKPNITIGKITKNIAGPVITIQDLSVNFTHIEWVLSAGNKKSDYIDTLLVSVQEMPKRWEGFYFQMQVVKKLAKVLHLTSDQNLENEEFNKKFFFESNDPVRLRILLTPAIQEALVKSYSQTKEASDRVLTWNENFFSTAISVRDRNLFGLTIKKIITKKLFAKSISREVVSKIKIIEEQLVLISTFREFIKNK